jgi:hypothetical protein
MRSSIEKLNARPAATRPRSHAMRERPATERQLKSERRGKREEEKEGQEKEEIQNSLIGGPALYRYPRLTLLTVKTRPAWPEQKGVQHEMTPVYCFECGVEVSESQEVFRNGRIYCSRSHAASARQTPASPQVKAASQPKIAQDPPKRAPAAQPATGPKVTTNPPAAPGKIPGRLRTGGLGAWSSKWF